MENDKKELMNAVLNLSNKIFKVAFFTDYVFVKEKELTYQELGTYLLTHKINEIHIYE